MNHAISSRGLSGNNEPCSHSRAGLWSAAVLRPFAAQQTRHSGDAQGVEDRSIPARRSRGKGLAPGARGCRRPIAAAHASAWSSFAGPQAARRWLSAASRLKRITWACLKAKPVPIVVSGVWAPAQSVTSLPVLMSI